MTFDKLNIHIGIDLDHTIVDYRSIFAERATALGFIDSKANLTKENLTEAKLNEADLTAADLTWAIKSAAKLKKAQKKLNKKMKEGRNGKKEGKKQGEAQSKMLMSLSKQQEQIRNQLMELREWKK